MTIAAAIVAGLFFMFTKDVFSGKSELHLAQIAGILYAIFIFSSGFWLTLILGQESSRLDRKIKFYQNLPEEMYTKIGKEIRNERVFNDYLRAKFTQSKALDTKIYGDKEYYFYIICGLFLLASLPIVALFIIKMF